MRISETFYSLQGEGRLAGTPSVFIRTSGCNLRCVWCDTPYTSWRPEGPSWPIDRILRAVEKHPTRHVVITGGEPLLAGEIEILTQELKRRYFPEDPQWIIEEGSVLEPDYLSRLGQFEVVYSWGVLQG